MKKIYITLLAGIGLVQTVSAQDTTKALDEVAISASKILQKQAQTGKVVTIIGQAQLQRSAGKTVTELLSEQAGIIVNGAGSNAGKDKSIFFRGAGSQYTVILIDGVVASDPGVGGAFDLRLLPVDQIERIEILKGGQSTLYGSDAVAGVINIVMKKDGKPGNNVFGVASAGTYNTYKGTIGLSSTVDRITYNLNLTHQRTDGISEVALPPTGSAVPFDKDGFRQTAFNGNVSIRLDDADRFRISPFIRYYTSKSGFDDGSFTDADNLYLSKTFQIGGTATYALPKGRFNLNYSHQNNERDYQTAFPAKYNGLMNLADLYYTQSIGKHVQVLAGIDNRYTFIKITDASLPNSSANQFAGYASVVLNKLSIFNLELGGRYNKHNRYGENYTYTVNPFLTFLNDNLKVFGTISTSFKAPDLIALYGPFGANPDLKPEKSDNYEAGFTTYFIDKKLSFRAVGYQRKINDAIVYVGQGYLNQNRQDARGFELEPSFKTEKLQINAFYSFVDGKTTAVNTAGQEVVTPGLIRRPKHSAGIFAGYAFTSHLFASANFRHYGKRGDLFFDNSTFSTSVVNLDAYNLVDAYLEYRIIKNSVRLFVDVKNIFNEKYIESFGYNTLGTNINAGVNFNIR